MGAASASAASCIRFSPCTWFQPSQTSPDRLPPPRPVSGAEDAGDLCFDSSAFAFWPSFDCAPSDLDWSLFSSSTASPSIPSSLTADTPSSGAGSALSALPVTQDASAAVDSFDSFDWAALDLPVGDPARVAPAHTAAAAASPSTAPIAGLRRRSSGMRTTAPNDDAIKRQRNSLAARKYRQKKIDCIAELESQVGQLQEERDALRIQLARHEAETAALRAMMMPGRGGD